MINVHATCVAFGNFGVLIRGPSGSGKSSLALRLIDAEGFGIGQTKLKAKLVADDQVMLELKASKVLASAPAALSGKIEIRGIEIVTLTHLKVVQLRLVVDLVPYDSIPRMPGSDALKAQLFGVSLPRIMLDAQCADVTAKLRAAVVHIKRNNTF